MNVQSVQNHPANYRTSSVQSISASFADTLSATAQTKSENSLATHPSSLAEALRRKAPEANSCFWSTLSMWNDTTVHEDLSSLTDKTFNVVATGDHQLTQDEIDDLRNRYDVTNLSRLDYYNLMADMTNLNAIAIGEIFHGYLKLPPSCVFDHEDPYAFTLGSTETGYKRYWAAPNMIERLVEARKHQQAQLDYVTSGDFVKENSWMFGLLPPGSDAVYTASFTERFIEEYEENERMIAIFRQLLPEGSEWAKETEPVPVRLTPKSSEEDAPDIGGISGEEAMNRDFSVPSKELLLGLIGKCSLLPGQWNSPVSELLEFLEEENSRKKDHPLAV